jgi:hypothetical protein
MYYRAKAHQVSEHGMRGTIVNQWNMPLLLEVGS